MFCFYLFFFFKQKTAYEMRISDWSSDVCSSDLRRKPSAFFLELHRTHGKLLCLFGGEAGTPRGNGSGNLFQAVLAHGLGEDGIGFLKRINPVDQVNVERSEEHTSELQSLMRISYAVFCLQKKKTPIYTSKSED